MSTSSSDATYDEQKRFDQEQKARLREISESLYGGFAKFERKEESLSNRVGTIEHLNHQYWQAKLGAGEIEPSKPYSRPSCSACKIQHFPKEIKGVEGDIEEAFVFGSNDCQERSSDTGDENSGERSILTIKKGGEQFRAIIPNDC
jgi:hypothetical protein